MDKYIVSARKYRPSTFLSVVGQKALTTTLQNAIKNKQLAHAYLFCGPRGVGKTTCARIFAKAINCMNLQSDGEACNECESCRSFEEQRSFNIYELDAASNNSVDDIRQLTEQVRIPPQLGKYKVYIIDEVHMLSQGAFNAFLKTLEEPPAHAVFILATTEKHKIPATILSRCQIYDFHRISVNDIQEYLKYVAQSEHIEYEPEALNIIAMKADGGMRDALSIFDQATSFGEGKISYKNVIENLNVLDYDYYFRLIDLFLMNQVSDALLLFNEVLNKGFEGLHFISGLCSHLRDLMVCKDSSTLKLLEVGDSIRGNYQKQAMACSFDFLLSALGTANECCLQYNQSKNKRLLVELCLIRLCQKNRPTPDFPDNTPIQPLNKSAASPANRDSSVRTTPTVPMPQSATPVQSVQTADTTHPATPTSTTTPIIQDAEKPKQPNPAAAPRTLSLKKQKAVQEEVEEQSQHLSPQIAENESFTETDLIQSWNLFAEDIQGDPQLRTSMLANQPKLLNDTVFEFIVFHANMQKRLNDIRPQIENHLQKGLHNGKIHMEIRISEGEEKKKALSSQEKLEAMMVKNPAMASLRQQLKLDLE